MLLGRRWASNYKVGLIISFFSLEQGRFLPRMACVQPYVSDISLSLYMLITLLGRGGPVIVVASLSGCYLTLVFPDTFILAGHERFSHLHCVSRNSICLNVCPESERFEAIWIKDLKWLICITVWCQFIWTLNVLNVLFARPENTGWYVYYSMWCL